MTPNEDTALLDAARAGDRRAVEALLRQNEARIYRFGLRMCGSPEDAEDVLQETMLAMARALPGFRGDASLPTWIYAIARSFCAKKRRRRKDEPAAHEPVDDLTALEDPRRAPDAALHGRQIEAALDAALDGLAPTYRDVLVLRDVEGLSAKEVAGVLGLKVDAVKSRLHRARAALRASLGALVEDEGAPAQGGAACPDVATMFSQSLEGEISAAVCEEMERHVAACARCRSRCDALKRTLSLCRASKAPEVPAAVQQAVRSAVRAWLAGAP